MNTISRQSCRIGGAGGVLFVLTLVIGVAVQGGEPVFDDPINEIRQEWTDEGQRYLVGDYLIGLAFVLFYIPFFVALRTLLGAAEGGTQLISRVAFVGAFMAMAWGAWASIFWGTLAFGTFADTASDETIETLMLLDYYASSGHPLAFAVFAGAASLVIGLTGVLWRWLAVPGAVAVALCLLAPLAILSDSSSGFFDVVYEIAFFVFILWVLLVAISMLAKRPAVMEAP